MLTESDQLALIAEANRAPSVHNTQPARWAFDGDYIYLFADLGRCLAVGDPELRDAGLSCGAALEGTLLALAERGIGVKAVHDSWLNPPSDAPKGLRPAARIKLGGSTPPDPQAHYTTKRYTWRGAFSPLSGNDLRRIGSWGEDAPNVTLVNHRKDKAWLAKLNDKTSLKFFANTAYREELVSWMRLNKSHPNWSIDGLNADSMQMSGFEARAASKVLSDPWFSILKNIGLGSALVSEASKTKSAAGIAFFHTHADTSPIDSGRQFYRVWLDLTRLGCVAWPMAVIADHPDTNAACCARFGIPDDQRLINVLRFGGPPAASPPNPARINPEDLRLNAN